MNTMKMLMAATVALTMGAAATAAAQPPAASTPAPAARLNPNTATAAQLGAVPGLTPALAAQIISKRPFKSASEFNAVLSPSLTPAQLATIYPRVFVPVNLNTGTREDILLIPGMTPRMVREFLEYRPYTSLDQYSREMAKYVDATEVARLRSYVTLN